MTFQQWQRDAVNGPARFFSLARHALVAALRAAGIGAPDRVLLPEFICRDLLASLHAVGATPVWYPIGEDLQPASEQEHWPQARAVIAVDYFGFPQPMEPFRAYAARTGALLIEDNAHGFLSRDRDGRWLGTRADAGIFSLRKTLPIADGALLLANGERLKKNMPEPLAELGRGLNPGVALKAKLRRLPAFGTAIATTMTMMVRGLRWMRTGHAIPPSDTADEIQMPCPSAAHAGMAAALATLDIQGEIERRRELYREAEAIARANGMEPLFPELSDGTAPYGFPFRLRAAAADALLRHWAMRRGLETIGWPDLPSAVARSPAAHYRDVNLVNFLC